MRYNKSMRIFLCLTLFVACLSIQAVAQSLQSREPVANGSADASEVKWQPNMEYFRAVLTVSVPGGQVIRREFETGVVPSFKLTDDKGLRLADGQYTYELRLIPNFSTEAKRALSSARKKGNSDEVVKELQRSGKVPAEAFVQSGSFLVENGAVYMGGEEEPRTPRGPGSGVSTRSKGKTTDPPTFTTLDQVIPDDLIVQGSACVGLDCVNNESFGFDTIRLKENNTRIKFDDTSTSAGFPANDWQLTANDSASGGSSKFSIEDITGSKVPFTITAGAATNSIFVDSTGRLGLRTSTPVLDIHANTSNTPAIRLEQNSSGGFTAQTWDIGANEANFFVRDLTGGSRLSFRIRPGAPTSSIDIGADGNVGIGAASSSDKVFIKKDADELLTARIENLNNSANSAAIFRAKANTAEIIMMGHADARTVSRWGVTLGGFAEIQQSTGVGLAIGPINSNPLILGTNSQSRIYIAAGGNIGLGGNNSPTSPIHHANGATLSAGGAWTNASSRELKMNIHSLSARDAFTALQKMNPVTFQYKAAPSEKHVGFIAEEVPDLISTSDRKGLSSMDIVAVLTKVIQEQQQAIAILKEKVERLEMTRMKKARHQVKR